MPKKAKKEKVKTEEVAAEEDVVEEEATEVSDDPFVDGYDVRWLEELGPEHPEYERIMAKVKKSKPEVEEEE